MRGDEAGSDDNARIATAHVHQGENVNRDIGASSSTDQQHSSAVIASHEPTRQASRSTGRWWISLPLTTFLALLFYAEGRAYMEGYLTYFGLDLTIFPVSPDDAYWYAFIGWIKIMGTAPQSLLGRYPKFPGEIWPTLVVILVVSVVFSLGMYKGWWAKPGAHTERAKPAARKIIAQLAMSSIPALMMAGLPVLLICVITIPMVAIAISVLPFVDVGKDQARDDCMAAASNYSIVHYVDESVAGLMQNSMSSARLLQCKSGLCVLIKNGEALVIPSAAVRFIEGRGVGRQVSYDPVPQAQQLCAKPGTAD